MPDGRWLLSCWEQYGREKNVSGLPSDGDVYECIGMFPKGTKPIYVQHLLAVLWGYHPRSSLLHLVDMVRNNKLGIDERTRIYVIKKELRDDG